MNHRLINIALFVISIFFYGIAQEGDSIALHDYLDSLSYVLGRDIGTQLKEIGTPLKTPAFVMGLQQALQGKMTQLDSLTTDSIRRRFAEFVRDHMAEQQEEMATKNRGESQRYLDKNKLSSGVKTTSTGLQYKILKKGAGPTPEATDSVVVHYRGSLIDNTVIDSTLPDQPITLELSRTIPGLSEGIQMMNIGSSYRFFIPPELAYGPLGAPPAIPPESVLIFDIELVDIPGTNENAGQTY